MGVRARPVSGAGRRRLPTLPGMPRLRTSAGALACALLVALVAGCTSDDGVREPGSAVTAAEAETLARLLQRNYQRGGGGFVVTTPHRPGSRPKRTRKGDVRPSE